MTARRSDTLTTLSHPAGALEAGKEYFLCDYPLDETLVQVKTVTEARQPGISIATFPRASLKEDMFTSKIGFEMG